MKNVYSTSPLCSGFTLLLLAALGGGLAASPTARAQDKDCFDEFGALVPCPGTEPAIWPDRSKPYPDADTPDAHVIRVLGWNLGGDPVLPWITDYEVVVVRPDGTPERAGMVVSDEAGDLLGDAVPEDEDPLGEPVKYAVPAPVDPADPGDPAFGTYEVRLYAWGWDESDPTQEPAATTTFFYNDDGN